MTRHDGFAGAPAKPHLHFMGIGGIGMSGLARWYLEDGYPVSGCDVNESSEVLALRALGIPVEVGHSPDHLSSVDTLIATMAVPQDHPELVAARAQGIKAMLRIELLRELLARFDGLTVTGTHGKSTTTGMLAHLLYKGGLEPSVLIGGFLPCLQGNVRYGRGRHFVAEVDESDPGFASLLSTVAIVTNLEDDHIAGEYDERRNYHASLEDLERATCAFAANAKTLLYCADWPRLSRLFGHVSHARSYGFHDGAAYRIVALETAGQRSRFTLRTPDGEQQAFELIVPGSHNVQNAAAAVAAAHLAGLPLAQAAEELAHFPGVGRRWQRRGSISGALIIDDYAHPPTEVGVTLQAAKQTGRRVRAVLQPHRWVRTARHWPALADAAALADEIIVLDIYSAGEQAIPGVSAQLIVERLREGGKRVSYHDLASAQDYLAQSLEANDLVITLGAGDVWKVAQGVVEARGGDDGSA